MGRNNENPSKYVSFKLVVDENDLSKSRNRNVNELDKEVYNTLCKVPVYMSITEFVKKAIVYYGRAINQKTDVTGGIDKIQGQSMGVLRQKLDNIESMLAGLSNLSSNEGAQTIPASTDVEVKTAPASTDVEVKTAPASMDVEVKTAPASTDVEVKTAPVSTEDEVKTTPASTETKATLEQDDGASDVIENFLKDFL